MALSAAGFTRQLTWWQRWAAQHTGRVRLPTLLAPAYVPQLSSGLYTITITDQSFDGQSRTTPSMWCHTMSVHLWPVLQQFLSQFVIDETRLLPVACAVEPSAGLNAAPSMMRRSQRGRAAPSPPGSPSLDAGGCRQSRCAHDQPSVHTQGKTASCTALSHGGVSSSSPGRAQPPTGRGRWAVSPARTPGTPGPCAKRVRGGGRRSLPAPCPAAPTRAAQGTRRCLRPARGHPRRAGQPEPCRRLADHAAGLPRPGPAAQVPWAPWSTGWTAQAATWMR